MPARSSWLLPPLLAALGFVLPAAFEAGVQAQAPTDASVAAGMRIYRQKADCQACHGWAGDGRKMDNQMPDGANLRTSGLDRDQLIFVIKCGLPGRDMPAFDRLAYGDDRCLLSTDARAPTCAARADAPRSRRHLRAARGLPVRLIGQGWTGPPHPAPRWRFARTLSKPRTARPQDEMPR